MVLFVTGAIAHPEQVEWPELFSGPAPRLTAFGLALIPVFFTYSGWNAAAYLVGEMRNPGRSLARGLIAGTGLTGWSDPEYDGWGVYYKITALDDVGNESDPSSPGTATAVFEAAMPETFALHQNLPNPFNPTTMIFYDVPEGGGPVTIRVYDVAGRLIRTLVDGVETSGGKRVMWNGRDNSGSRVATGVYFYRMTAPGFTSTRKMILLQ